MKITHVETYPVRIPLKPERRMVSALGRHEVSQYLLVRLGTDAGVEGVGEATVMPRWSGETVWGAKAVVERVLAPVVVGCDPADTREIDRRMDQACADNWFAKAAIEMACWDIEGRAVGKPVYELLGGACRPLAIRSRFSLVLTSPNRRSSECESSSPPASPPSRSKSAGSPSAISPGCVPCALPPGRTWRL